MKHLRIYEEFDLDKFLEDPSGNIHDDEDPEINPGDWVTSYRGIGQVLDMGRKEDGLVKVELVNSAKSIVKVPFDKLVKIKKEEADLAIFRIPQTTKELEKIGAEMENYSEAIDSYSEDFTMNDPESAIDFLEDILIKVIDLKKRDPYTIYHKEYAIIIMGFANLVDIIMDSTEDQNLIGRLEKIDNDFYEISE
jgi:hypothetical protein